MLSSLNIENVVLIEHLNISFEDGLCALTGETGAGKSILLDSLGLALGERSESRLVRAGSDKAQVNAVFDVPAGHICFTILKDAGFDLEAGEVLILRRSLSADGRSRAFINDQAVSVSLLKKVGSVLIEIHGQNDTRGLLDPSAHRGLLDEYAGIKNDVQDLWKDWQDKHSKLETLKRDAKALKDQEEYLRVSLEDLEALDPQAGEEEILTTLRETLKHREQVLEALNIAYHALNADDDPTRSAWGALDRVSDKLPQSGQDAISALDRAVNEAQEAIALIQSASSDLEHSEHDLESVDERLYTLRAQARKHACSVDDLSQKCEELRQQLSVMDEDGGAIQGLEKEVDQARDAYIKLAQEIRKERIKAGSIMDELIGKELAPLKMERARFVTSIEELPEEQWNAYGIDQVRFLVSTNPGSDPGPLHKIASGGEMSRFMLALKVVMAAETKGQTLIFDEVDAGIGGQAANAVGERLSRLAYAHQVLIVTHSPQVAARAGYHWIVKKDGTSDNENNIVTNVVPLPSRDDRREEIARMLAGASITDEARAAADKLLEVV